MSRVAFAEDEKGKAGWIEWVWSEGAVASAPAAVGTKPGTIHLFARGLDGLLLHNRWKRGEWGKWRPVPVRPVMIIGKPAAVTTRPKFAHIFARGVDNALWYLPFLGGVFGEWVHLGGELTSSPAAVSWGEGHVDVFAAGRGGILQHRVFMNGVWGPWEPFAGSPVAGAPAVAARAPGRIDIFARAATAPTSALLQWSLDNRQWTQSPPHRVQIFTDPAVVAWDPQRLDVVFGGGADRLLRLYTWDKVRWSPDVSIGGGATDAPAIVSMVPGRLDIFTTSTDNHVWHKRFLI